MNPPFWQPTKLQLYEALYSLNRDFEAALLSLERLERLGLFRPENLNAFKVSLEQTRAQANEELSETLHDYEQEESVRFDRLERDWENRCKDPEDVFFAAQERKQQIKEQIRDLQRGLKRQTFKPRSEKKPR